MDQEKMSLLNAEDPAEKNAESAEDAVTEIKKDSEVLVPDDAFAEVSEETEPAEVELLPQSLDDELEPLDDEDDLLFTDEELTAFNDSLAAEESAEQPQEPSDEITEAPVTDPSIPDRAESEGEDKPKRINGIFDMLEMFVFALAFVLLAMAFCFRHSVVDGNSMNNTLKDGEHLIISSLFYTPKQGDIVVVQDASKEDTSSLLTKPIVKRVIATEGQTVRIEEGRKVYVDGVLLIENYVHIDDPSYDYDTLEMTVEEGCVFLMGDHRNDSADSRGAAGAFREEAILGKVVLRFLPLHRFGAIK